MTARSIKCATCKTEFQTRKRERRYCCRDCYVEAIRELSDVTCPECGKDFRPKAKRTRFCSKTCANRHTARNRPNSRGWYKTTKGYILRYLPSHPKASKTGYMMEHRLVMEAAVGRTLQRSEVVHHKNGDKADNRLENLELLQKKEHDRRRPPIFMVTCPCCRESFPARGNVHAAEHPT